MMIDILNETIQLAKEEIVKREKIPEKELVDRAKKQPWLQFYMEI